MALMSLGQIDKKCISILLGCIFCFLNRLINQYENTLLFKNTILTNIFIASGKLFIVIPFIIFKIRTKVYNTDIENINENKNIKNTYIDKLNSIIKGKWKYLLLSAVIFFAQGIIFVYAFIIKSNSWVWGILITSIFCYLIFKIKLFKHHYFSVIFIILIGLIIDIISGNLKNDITNNLVLLLLRFVREIVYSFHDVIDKYIMEKTFGSVYDIALSNGVITLILFGIFGIFDYYYFHLDNWQKYFDNFKSTEFLVILGVIITQFGLYLSILFTIKNYSPCHVFIIMVFGQISYYLDFSSNSIIIIICLIFVLLLSLIFNEIIEINVCGLSNNTKKNIIMRSQTEDDIYFDTNTIGEFDIISKGKEEYILKEKDFNNNEFGEEDSENENTFK